MNDKINFPADFWVLETFYYEQPSINHLNELLVILYTEKATHSFGTTADLNFLVDSHQHKAGVISVQNKDVNGDSKADQIEVKLSFNDIEPSAIKSIVIIQSLSYAISVRFFHFIDFETGESASRV